MCDFTHLNLGLLSNILQYGFHIDWTIRSVAHCKTKSYLLYVLTIISGTLTTLASINQFMLSSKRSSMWNYSCRSVGMRNITLTIFFWITISIPIGFCSERHYYSSDNELIICFNPCRYLSCRLVHVLYTCLLNGFLPPLITMVFGLLTYRNVRRLRRRSKSRSSQTRQINKQLTSMLILQSFKSIVTSFPYAIFNCYWVKTVNQQKSLSYQTIENLINQIVHLLFWTNYTSFFIYIYVSKIFRRQWIKTIKKIIRCFWRKRRTMMSSSA